MESKIFKIMLLVFHRLTPERAFTRAFILGVRFVPKKVPKGPISCLKDPSQARLCYCFDLKFAIKLLVERDKTSTVQLVKI